MNESRRWIWIPAASLPLSLLLGVLAFAACQTPTSVTLTVSTDADCAGQEQSPQAHVVTGAPDDIIGRLTASSTKECVKSGDVGSLVLLPKDDENAPLGIKVILGVDKPTEDCGKYGATDLDKWAGCIVARRRLGFIEGEALVVDVPLHLECRGIPCSEEGFETCVAGGRCVSADIDPNDCLDGPCTEGDLPPVASTGVGPSSSSTTSGSTSGGGEGGGSTSESVSSASSGGGLGGAGGNGGEGGGPECLGPGQCTASGPCWVAVCVDGSCDELPAEGGVLCLSGVCDGSGSCVACVIDANCAQIDCKTRSCDNGSCSYADGNQGGECAGGTCVGGECFAPPHCSNNEPDLDLLETDIDCGGPCPNCKDGDVCAIADDCISNFCDAGICALCVANDDCDLLEFCSEAGVCADDLPNGEPCADDSGCLEGECSGGTCCDEPCDGACRGCGLGECVDLVESPACAEGLCTLGCIGGVCTHELPGTECGQSCTYPTETTLSCNGTGACSIGDAKPCGLYDCVGTACGPDCNDGNDCVAGAVCNGAPGVCQAGCQVPNDCAGNDTTCQVRTCISDQCGVQNVPNGTDCGSECSVDNILSRRTCQQGVCSTVQTNCCAYACDADLTTCPSSCTTPDECNGGACINNQCSGGVVDLIPGNCAGVDSP